MISCMSWQAKPGLWAQISNTLRAEIARTTTSVSHSAVAVRAFSEEKMPISPIISPGPSTMSISSRRMLPRSITNMSSDTSPTRNKCWPSGMLRDCMYGTSQSAEWVPCWRGSLNAIDIAGPRRPPVRFMRLWSSKVRISATSRTIRLRARNTHSPNTAPATMPSADRPPSTRRIGSREGTCSSSIIATGRAARASSVNVMAHPHGWRPRPAWQASVKSLWTFSQVPDAAARRARRDFRSRVIAAASSSL